MIYTLVSCSTIVLARGECPKDKCATTDVFVGSVFFKFGAKMVYFLTFPIFGLLSIEVSYGTPVLRSISPRNHREDVCSQLQLSF